MINYFYFIIHIQLILVHFVDKEYSRCDVRVAHIYQKQWPPLFLKQFNIDVTNLANLLILHKIIEKAYDRFDKLSFL